MFKNYIKIALRNILRQKVYSFINIIGLAVGMAVCIIILMWIQTELTFDKFHENLDDIYLVTNYTKFGNKNSFGTGNVPALGPALKAEYPEIVNSTRMNNSHSEYLITYNEKPFKERIKFADPSIFEIFSLPFIQGNYETAKYDFQTIFISEGIAEKHFKGQDIVGETIFFDNQFYLTVGGIFKNIPENSSLQFDIVVPVDFLNELWYENATTTWFNLSYTTYIQLTKGTDYKQVKEKIKNRIKDSLPKSDTEVSLYPFSRMRLFLYGFLGMVILFSYIAILILVIACINFINLTTARSSARAREVGLRKVVGGSKKQIMMQFFSESIIMSIFALFIAIGLVEVFLPVFGEILQRNVAFNLSNKFILLGIPAITILTGILSGIYPAIVLSSFKPTTVLKSGNFISSTKSPMRKVLVIFQFVVSIVLIISIIVIYKQTRFMKNKGLGFDKKHLIYMKLDGDLKENYPMFKNELLQNRNIFDATVSSQLPTGSYMNGSGWKWDGIDENLNPLVTALNVDYDYLATMKLEMKQGNFFSEKYPTNSPNIIINERYAEVTGLENPIGTTIYKDSKNSYNVIGIIKDFHYMALSNKINPLFIFCSTEKWGYRYLTIRIDNADVENTITEIKKITKKYNPEFPFEFGFLEDDLEAMYRKSKRIELLLASFAVLAIVISCLGLFGLSSYMTEQRTKEIGIRKVHGASVIKIVKLLTSDFTKSILIANAIGWVLAFVLMELLLLNFPYKIKLDIWIFVLPGLATLVLALLVISFQTIKCANSNPVKALKYE
ncbi:MAG: ABC transporter permease [Candidatus Cloacimonetes bacterium]|nr:ABC transporter permease [Candidatus Cloacimonadota bacterium]